MTSPDTQESRREEVANSVSHGLGFVLAVAGAPLLIATAIRRGTLADVVAVSVFAASMALLYLSSTIYHALPPGRTKNAFHVLDHAAIYLLIAGTYTPVAAIVLDPPWNWIVLTMVWGITIGGVVQKGLFPKVPGWISVMMSTILGWLGVFFFWPMIQRLGWLPVGIVLAGGLLYTIGMVFLVTNRPRLWPRVFSYHEVFHIMVVSATSLHFFVIWRYVVPLAAT